VSGCGETVRRCANCGVRLCNAFSYWQGQMIANATASFFDDIMQAFGHIQTVAGSASKTPELWVGETGMLNLVQEGGCTDVS